MGGGGRPRERRRDPEWGDEMNVADAIAALQAAAEESGFDVDLLLEELLARGLED